MWRTYKCLAMGLAVLGSAGGAGVARGQVVTGNGATATSLNVQTLQTGTVLNVTPAASADLRYVGMAINPQFSVLEGVDTFVLTNTTSTGATGGVVGATGQLQAVAIRRIPFRPAQVGKVTFVDTDKPLLATRVKAVAWKGVTMKEAVRRLSDVTKLNMVLGIKGLEQAGVDLTVTRDYAVAAGTVKEALLGILQVGVAEKDMVISAEDKVITITTQGQADQQLVTKTYYLEDLLANLPRFVAGDTNLYDIGMGKPATSGLDEAAADTRRSMDLSKPPAEPKAPKAVAAKKPPASTNILEMITDTVRPEIWKNHGGKSEISMVGNRVTIKAPESVHALLDGPKVYNPNKIDSYVNYAR